MNNNEKFSFEKKSDNPKTFYDVIKKPLAATLIFASLMIPTGCSGERGGEEPGPAFEYIEFQEDKPIFISVTELGESKFIDRYGYQYSDPESTYQALSTYEEMNEGESVFINPEYIPYYESKVHSGEREGIVSELGFETPVIPFDQELSFDFSVEYFNSFVKKQINKCANYLSFNPEAEQIIRDQFLSYCSSAYYVDGEFAGYNEEGFKLFDTIKSTVEKYDENSYFNVLPASTEYDDPDVTFFDEANAFQPSQNGSNSYSNMIAIRFGVQQFSEGETAYFTDQPDFGDKMFVLRLLRDSVVESDGTIEYSDILSMGQYFIDQ